MQLDFHYYCVAVLARAAGFKSQDALDLAYASQYVDNATETGRVELEFGSDALKPTIRFDQVRTAYFGLEALHTLTWDAQKRVWIPFHFLPPRVFDPHDGSDFSFITEKNSSFARLLLDEAAAEPLDNHTRRLCRIGVARHTYADSWSHADFSGRDEKNENDVEGIHIWDKEAGDYEHLAIENVLFDAMPFIGHGEAGYFPDLSFASWKFSISNYNNVLERDNAVRFLEAAEAIHGRLRDMDKANGDPIIDWDVIGPRIHWLLAKEGKMPNWVSSLTLPAYRAFQAREVDRRCKNWRDEFKRELFDQPRKYMYNELDWRREALKGPVDWNDSYERLTPDMELRQKRPRQTREGFWESRWVHFHRAALLQRHYVLEHLP